MDETDRARPPSGSWAGRDQKQGSLAQCAARGACCRVAGEEMRAAKTRHPCSQSTGPNAQYPGQQRVMRAHGLRVCRLPTFNRPEQDPKSTHKHLTPCQSYRSLPARLALPDGPSPAIFSCSASSSPMTPARHTPEPSSPPPPAQLGTRSRRDPATPAASTPALPTAPPTDPPPTETRLSEAPASTAAPSACGGPALNDAC